MKSKFLYSTMATLAFGLAMGLANTALAAGHHKAELTDDLFAKKAAAGGLTEVELGKLAAANGDSQDVKDFGAKMVTDHGKANDNLKEVAVKDNLTIPDKPNAMQQAMIDKLSKESGKEFDTAYINGMLKAHIQDKALFTKEIEIAKNPDLKEFAQTTLSVVEGHLDMIRDIARAHGIAAAGHEHHKMMAADSTSSMSTGMPDHNVGTSGESKSGLAPGGNANPAPVTSPSP